MDKMATIRELEDMPELLTVKHLCVLTGLSDQTIRREVNEGRLPGFKVGRRIFVAKTRFLEYMDEGGNLYA